MLRLEAEARGKLETARSELRDDGAGLAEKRKVPSSHPSREREVPEKSPLDALSVSLGNEEASASQSHDPTTLLVHNQ